MRAAATIRTRPVAYVATGAGECEKCGKPYVVGDTILGLHLWNAEDGAWELEVRRSSALVFVQIGGMRDEGVESFNAIRVAGRSFSIWATKWIPRRVCGSESRRPSRCAVRAKRPRPNWPNWFEMPIAGSSSSPKVTLGEWLQTWLTERAKATLRPGSFKGYQAIVKMHLTPALGSIRLHALRPGHLTEYYLARQTTLSRATLDVHHAILSSALRSAVRQRLVTRNVAADAEGRPKAKDGRVDAKQHCWTPEEARAFLVAAAAAGPQLAALFALALDTGMRKGEILGLPWTAVDLDAGTVVVDRGLLATGPEPTFGPTKTGGPRTVHIGTETVRRLAEHRRAQAELKMRNRTSYQDYGLVFAKEWGDLHGREDSLGRPLGLSNFGQREFARVIKAAQVRTIKFHGLRHTSATLLLAAGEPVHVVAARLGHSKVTTTLETYAHALPGHGQQAARTLGGLLYDGAAHG